MDLKRLKELLENGVISQDEFDAMAKSINETETNETEQEETTETETTETKEKNDDTDDLSKFEKLIQSKIDRALAKERKDKAEFKRKYENLQKKMLTDDEKKELEFKQQQQEIEEQRKELMLEKNKMYAVKSMKKANISDSEEAMLLMEKLVSACEDEAEIDETIELLKAWKDKDVAAEVDKRFKTGGHVPKKADNLNGGVNPWKAESFNLTEQMRIETADPSLAQKLMQAAGVK